MCNYPLWAEGGGPGACRRITASASGLEKSRGVSNIRRDVDVDQNWKSWQRTAIRHPKSQPGVSCIFVQSYKVALYPLFRFRFLCWDTQESFIPWF